MPRILIVEDDAHQRLLYREELERDGYEVVEAADGREALARVSGDAPDAVVLDVNMPGMDGLDTLTSIHELDRSLPIVLHSAYAQFRDHLVSWIADAYVVKSSNLDALRAAIQSAVVKRARTREIRA